MDIQLLKALDAVQIDPKSPANISYVKARCVIEEIAKSRKDRREAKMAVITLLNGNISHQQAANVRGTVKKDVIFPDGTVARF
jgi:uncharacterized protein (DUF2267 family)